MESDPIREKIKDLLRRRDLNMREASVRMGRNVTYLHQFLTRGQPRVLGYKDSETLAELLGCDVDELRHDTVPRRKQSKRKRRPAPAGLPGVPLSSVPEMEVEASAGPGALADEFVIEKARWFLPEGMIRYEGDASPDDLRIVRVRGNSMEPEMREGDRLMVDVARRIPATGEMFVLWDGAGLVVKRIEHVRDADPPRLRLKSTNPDYDDYTCDPEEAHIVGKVLWTVRRV